MDDGINSPLEKNLNEYKDSSSQNDLSYVRPNGTFPYQNTIATVNNPPKNYKIGDVYVKQKLASRALNIEHKVNYTSSDVSGIEERISILDEALNGQDGILQKIKLKELKTGYIALLDEAEKCYTAAEEDLAEIDSEIKSLSSHLSGTSNNFGVDVPALSQQSNHETLDSLQEIYKSREKDLFDAHTTKELLLCYVKRMKDEINLLHWKKNRNIPIDKFKILRDSDQLI